MPAARGKKRKGTRVKNEGNLAAKKPVLSEDTKTNLSDNCSPELNLDDQKLKQEYVTGTGSMDNTNSCMSGADNASKAVGDTLGSNNNPGDVQDQPMKIPCVETPSNVEKNTSHSTLENESIGDKDEDNIKSHTYINGPSANLDSSPAELPNNEDEENPLEILKAPSGSKAKVLELEVHSEDIQALACYNDSSDTEPFRASFLSASQPVTSTRISKSLYSKISKGFKPPPTINDLDIARQPSENPKKNKNVIAEKEKSNRDDADIRSYVFNTPHHKLSSEVSEPDIGPASINSDKCESDLNLKERHEGDKTEEVRFHLDNDNISEDGKSRLQQNGEETSNFVAVNPIREDKSQGPDNQLHFESSTEFENKKLAIPFTEAHVDNDTSKRDDNQSISPKRTNKEAKQHFEKADRSYEDSKKLHCGPYSSVHEDDHCSDTVSQSSGMGTQGFVADPSNGSGQGSSEHLGSSDDTNTCRSDNNNMAFGHPQSARPKTLAVEMFGSPTTKNGTGSIDQCTFSPLVGLTDRSCQKQKSPLIKFPGQIDATEAIDSTDCQRHVVQGYKKDSFHSITKFDEIAMKSLENKAGLTVKPASVCLEQSLKLTTSESSETQGQVKSTGNSKADCDKLGLPITECFHTSNLELDQQKENKTYQHLKNNETGVVSGLPDTDSTITSTLNKQSPTSTQPFTCSNKNELSTNSSNIAEPFMDKREDINTISSPMRFRDMISEKSQFRDKSKEGKQEDKNKLPREAVATDTFSSDIESRAGNLESIKPEDDSPAPHVNTMMKAITVKKSSDDSCDKMSDVEHQDKLEINCDVSGDSDSLSMFGKFPFSKQTWSISLPQNDGSQTESSDLGDAKNESKSATDTEISIEKEKINERQNPTMLTTTSTLNTTAELNKTEQASEMACGNMTVDEILDILSVSESRAKNIGCENYNTQPTGNEISFTTKTQSYALSETVARPDEQNPVDLEQPLADVLDDIQSTRTDLDFCDDLDAQTLLFDNDNINKGIEPNEEDIEMIDRFENNFQKKQKSAVEQVNMKKVEGASIIKAIMGDLVFTNRQLVKMKKEMDLLSRSLERIGKQQDNTDKGARSIGSW